MDAQSSHDPASGRPSSSSSSLGLHGADGPDFVFPSEIPELDFAVSAAGDKFSEAAALHVHVCDPLVVFAPDADHFCRGLEALVEDADGTVAVAGDEGGAFDGIVGQGGDGGIGTGGDILVLVSILVHGDVSQRSEHGNGIAHVGTDLGGSIPHPYRLDIARDQQLPLALLPIQDQSGILRARHMVGQSAESGDEFDAFVGFVVAENLDNAIGGPS